MARLNILPSPTFAHLGVNYTERPVSAFEKEEIDLAENERRQIVQYRSSDGETAVTVGSGAVLKLVQVFSGSCASRLTARLGDNSRLELIQLFAGGDTVSETAVTLSGIRSVFKADIGYDLGGNDALDTDLVSVHNGKKSVSDINVSGVLRDSARKTFKGTIDFRTGSSGSKGSEKEDVILTGERAVNKTVPVILCSEEDVDGSHGAALGRIDERHIFYMRSRGIPEERIREMLTRGKLARIIKKIGDEQTEKKVYELFGWGDDID